MNINVINKKETINATRIWKRTNYFISNKINKNNNESNIRNESIK